MNISHSMQRSFLRQRLAAVRVCLWGRKPLLARQIIIFPAKENLKKSLRQARHQNREVKKTSIPVFSMPAPIAVSPVQALPTAKIATEKAVHPRFSLRTFLFLFFLVCSFILLFVLFAPTVYYSFFSADPVPIRASETGTPLGGKFSDGSKLATQHTSPLPPYDANLPDGNWLIIPRIGVRTQILDSARPEDSLPKGVWRVPDFATPGKFDKPMILAAHRIGYIWWWEDGGQYAKLHSFYNLPSLQQGDMIQIISDHREYTYEVYAGEKGTDITDYSANLILYTCQSLEGPIRYFRYARLIDPTKNTQEG